MKGFYVMICRNINVNINVRVILTKKTLIKKNDAFWKFFFQLKDISSLISSFHRIKIS